MIVVEGKKTRAGDLGELWQLTSPYAGLSIDLGTGDGRFAYRYASSHPTRFVIGIDPVAEAMAAMSARARRKPERGGLPNVLYVVASVERVPPELEHIADEIFVNLPWGSLMRGIILGDQPVLAGLAALAAPGGRIRTILNTRIFDDPVPVEARDLPEVTPAYVRDTIAPAFARLGIEIDDARYFDADEVADLGTTWAKRLSHHRPPPSVVIEAHAAAKSGGRRGPAASGVES